jgi:hypothetical protein
MGEDIRGQVGLKIQPTKIDHIFTNKRMGNLTPTLPPSSCKHLSLGPLPNGLDMCPLSEAV